MTSIHGPLHLHLVIIPSINIWCKCKAYNSTARPLCSPASLPELQNNLRLIKFLIELDHNQAFFKFSEAEHKEWEALKQITLCRKIDIKCKQWQQHNKTKQQTTTKSIKGHTGTLYVCRLCACVCVVVW